MTRKRALIIGGIAVVLLIGAAGYASQPGRKPAAAPLAQPADTPVGYVSRAMLGERWPLTVTHGTLSCIRGSAVFFDAPNGRTYAVNGMAATMFPALDDIDDIWADNPDPATRDVAPKRNIGPLIDRGLALC